MGPGIFASRQRPTPDSPRPSRSTECPLLYDADLLPPQVARRLETPLERAYAIKSPAISAISEIADPNRAR